jgi:hypothetical protein
MTKQFPSASEKQAVLRTMQQLRRTDLLDAFSKLDAGVTHPFGKSTNYDVLHGIGRYPPKAVVGVAIAASAGLDVGPYHFKGGLGTPCFRALQAHGFTIEQKPSKHRAP